LDTERTFDEDPGDRDRRAGREWLRGGEACRGAEPGSHLPRHSNAETFRLRGVGALGRACARRHLHDGLRRVRATGLRGARGGLFAQAGRAAAISRCGGSGARAVARENTAAVGAGARACGASPGRRLERILIRQEGRVHVLPVDRIDFIEAQDDYLSFAVGGKRLRKQQTMTDIESQLDPTRFVRIHRSFIMNVERLARIDLYGKDSWLAILSDGTKLPMSRTGHARLKELIG